MLYYYPITAPANTNVIIISVLLIIAGGLMIGAYTILIYSSVRLFDTWFCSGSEGFVLVRKVLFCIGCVTVRLYNSRMSLLHTLCMQVFFMIIFSLVVGGVAAGMSGPVSIMIDTLYILLVLLSTDQY